VVPFIILGILRMTGFVQIYTGDGKGKTTAALGLALRAAGAGLRVFIAQFLKCQTSSELKSLLRLAPEITVRQYGRPSFINGEPTPEDIAAAERGLHEARDALLSGKYDVLILDEINIALHFRILPVESILSFIDEKPEGVELILTGRNADPRLIDRADLVTEMRDVKHYFKKGIPARPGIEE
jgi:cob(I)alamin adenosyltransferase